MEAEDFSLAEEVLCKFIFRLLGLVGKLTSFNSGTSAIDAVKSF